MILVSTLLPALPRSGQAQTSYWLDAAVSSARPPAGGAPANTSSYAIIGARAETLQLPWKFTGVSMLGQAMEDGGRWLWLEAEAERPLGKAGAFFFDYEEVFRYRLMGLQLQRDFRLLNDQLTVRPRTAVARWEMDSLSSAYAVAGGSVQWQRDLGKVQTALSGDAFVSGDNGFARGGYFSLRGDVFRTFDQFTVGAGLTQAVNPLRNESGYALWASHIANDHFRIDAQLARTVSEPVFGSPRSVGFTLVASWRFSHTAPAPTLVLAEVGDVASRGRMVKFTVEVDSARTVAVSGTFSDWRPLPLRREGAVWTGSFAIEPGTHQYGFLLDGTAWYVPPDAPDVIDDGFGRKNVTLVVRPK